MKVTPLTRLQAYRGSHREKGFTLLEIMVAVFIFSVIVTVIFGSFNSVFSTQTIINDHLSQHEMIKNCMNRIAVDLAAAHVTLSPAYKPPEIDTDPDPHRIVGDKYGSGVEEFSRLRFASQAHVPLSGAARGGVAEIVYYTDIDQQKQTILRRADNLFPYPDFEPKVNDPILCANLTSFQILFYDHQGNEYKSWDSESDEFDYATPVAIGIKLKIGDAKRSQLFHTKIFLSVNRSPEEE